MELDERKIKILQAIIQTYLDTGEPVGSRTISRYSGLNLSSATIRNEMSDLEELGYILQPHTSAGRIPSDKGYRLYVNQLMEEKAEKEEQASLQNGFLIERVDRLELLLKQLAKILAVNTNYATMITGPQGHHNKLKFIQLSKLSDYKLLVVIVVEGNIIKNVMIDIQEELSDEAILNLNILLNSSLNGLTIEEINLARITKLKEDAGNYSGIISSVLDEVAKAFTSDEDLQVYTSGTTNIFKYPELSDGQIASELISTLEEKQVLANLMNDPADSEKKDGIQVYIGHETSIQTMKDCSVVTTTYELGEGIHGTIGVIGPKRMDYNKVVSTLKTLVLQLDAIFKKT